jgi:WD40 repeat protein
MKKISNSKLLQERGVSSLSFSQKGDYCALATKKDHTIRIFRVANLSNVDSWQELQELG